MEKTISHLEALGATVVDPANIPIEPAYAPENTALLYEFKHDIRAYLRTYTGRGPRTAARSIARKAIDSTLRAHRLDAIVAPTNSPAWTTDLVNGDHFLLGSSTPAAVAGYANVTVPAGYSFGLPVGVSFIGGRWAEPKLIGLAYAWEHATHVRKPPQFLPTLPTGAGAALDRAGRTSAHSPF